MEWQVPTDPQKPHFELMKSAKEFFAQTLPTTSKVEEPALFKEPQSAKPSKADVHFLLVVEQTFMPTLTNYIK